MTNQELEQEYQKFKRKFFDACKDMNDAINELSPENLRRFKYEVREMLPTGLINLFNALKD